LYNQEKEVAAKIPLTNITTVHDYVLTKLQTLSKNYPKELLLRCGATQGLVGNIPVLAFPMEDCWHCINYTNYPEEPRFLNAASREKQKVKIDFLGKNIFDVTSETVFLTEGIWDLLTLLQYDYPALGLPGVNNLKDEWIEMFRGKDVFIIFDNDEPGRQFAEQHGKRISIVARSTKIITLPYLVKYKGEEYKVKDISDLFKAADLKTIKEFLQQLIDKSIPLVVNIKEQIAGIALGKGNKETKASIITDIIIKDIYTSSGKLLPFNNNQEFAVVLNGKKILLDEKIDVFLKQCYEYIPSDILWRYVKDRLHNESLQYDEVIVDLYSTFQNGKCYIGIKNEGLIIVEKDGCSMELQGINNIYVKSSNMFNKKELEHMCEEKAPNSNLDIKTIEDAFEIFSYDVEEDSSTQKYLLKIWFYYTFFNPGIKPVLCIVGPPGCGKTLLLKILKGILFGFHSNVYNPNSIPEEDYVLTMMLKEYKYLFLDEVNERNVNIKSKLRMLVTGEETVIRPKYARSAIKFRPNIWLALSAHSPKFREPDIAQRLCIINLEMPKQEPISESVFFRKMEESRPTIFRNILHTLQSIINNMKNNQKETIPLKQYCRQLDMANFAWKVFPEQRELCLQTFSSMDSAQSKFSAEFDPLLDVFEVWYMEKAKTYLSENGHITVNAKQLYEDLSPIVRERGIRSFPSSIKGLGKWIVNRSNILGRSYGFQRIRNISKDRWDYVFITPDKEVF